MNDTEFIYFGMYLKDYLEGNHISQSEFANRLGITQKHMNEILNGKANITLEMAANIERLTDISASFITEIENDRKMKEELLKKYGSEKELKETLKNNFSFNELKKNNWISFKDVTDTFRNALDILNFLKVKNFDVHENLEKQVLFKKTGEDYNKIALWISHCDEIALNQNVSDYSRKNFDKLINELKKYSFEKGYDLKEITKIFNKYGVYFVCEKALNGTKIRGCFKVKETNPAIYCTQNYHTKDSLYFEIFHELGHCKSDYNMAKNKTIIDGNKKIEERADEFAINTMILKEQWNEINKAINGKESFNEIKNQILYFSNKYKIPLSFIVGRMAKMNMVNYNSKIYNELKNL